MISECNKQDLFDQGVETVLPCDIPRINEALGGGFRTGDLVVLQAPTGEGKSTFLMRMAIKGLLKGRRVLYMSCGEQSAKEVRIRMLCMFKELEYHGTHIEGYSEEERDKILSSWGSNYFNNLTVSYCEDEISYGDIMSSIQNGVDLIVIDYLGACLSPDGQDSQYAYLTRVASHLKGIATENNVCIMTAMQTNRQLRTELAGDNLDPASIDGAFMGDSIGPARKATVCLSMFTYKGEKYLVIFKNRFNGKIDYCKVLIDPRSYQMHEKYKFD